ncbi:MAG: SCP2 sterol-binding domain-containing protein [Bacteroidota bacterium]
MNLEALTSEFSKRANQSNPVGATFKFVLDDMVIHVDGTGDSNVITNEDKEADCTISASMDTFMKIQQGKLNPMMAAMTGKVKIKGDMGLAMKLQSLLG